jgi:Putative prokaryotic signal transducing protein
MAQDPEEEVRGGGTLDRSHELDMVTLYESNTVDAGAEADVIRGLLEANGIPANIVGPGTVIPAGFIIQVPRGRLEEAQRLIDEARATGPEGAAEAEASTEDER